MNGLGESSAGRSEGASVERAIRSEIEALDKGGWTVKRGNSSGGGPLEKRDRSTGRKWMDCEV